MFLLIFKDYLHNLFYKKNGFFNLCKFKEVSLVNEIECATNLFNAELGGLNFFSNLSTYGVTTF